MPPPSLPPSSSNALVSHLAYAAAMAVFIWLAHYHFQFVVNYGLLMIVIYAAIMMLWDLGMRKVWRNPTANLADRPVNAFSWRRIALKYLGLAGMMGALAFCYWLFPEYRAAVYRFFFRFLRDYIVYIAVLSAAYIAIADRFMRDPHDGMWQFGALLARRHADRGKIADFCRSWLVRGFFLPLMLGFFVGTLNTIATFRLDAAHDFKQWFDYIYNVIMAGDLIAAVIGYALAARVLDNHIQSTDNTVGGWFVCLVCYAPFWPSLLYNAYFPYAEGAGWLLRITDPTWRMVYGGIALGIVALYASASLVFGLRWSNLTYRGVITSGPYRITKHPAYVFKNLFYWMTALPFIPSPEGNWEGAAKATVMLVCINAIYFMRAKTEERHLSRYPEYRAYAHYMERHGWFRWMGRLVPALRYKVPL